MFLSVLGLGVQEGFQKRGQSRHHERNLPELFASSRLTEMVEVSCYSVLDHSIILVWIRKKRGGGMFGSKDVSDILSRTRGGCDYIGRFGNFWGIPKNALAGSIHMRTDAEDEAWSRECQRVLMVVALSCLRGKAEEAEVVGKEVERYGGLQNRNQKHVKGKRCEVSCDYLSDCKTRWKRTLI